MLFRLKLQKTYLTVRRMFESDLISVSPGKDRQTVSFAPDALNRSAVSTVLGKALQVVKEDTSRRLVCIDLGQTKWIGSSGLSQLIRIHRHVRGLGGHVILDNVGEPVRETLRLTRLERLFGADGSAGDFGSAGTA